MAVVVTVTVSVPNYKNSLSLQSAPFQTSRSIISSKSFHFKRRNRSPIAALPDPDNQPEREDNIGVNAAVSVLKFYKREISPILPKSCRYVPSCSEYSMQAYKKYGFFKGSLLTAWRLCRCNPLGGSGFDPPRWFGEEPPLQLQKLLPLMGFGGAAHQVVTFGVIVFVQSCLPLAA